MRIGENELNLTTEWPELPERSRFRALPGRVAVLMCDAPERVGQIHLTDRSSGNLRPDAGVVAAVGTGVDLAVGDRVYVRPYVGLHIHTDEGTYRLLGREVFEGEHAACPVNWWEHVVAYVSRETSPVEIPGEKGVKCRA